MDQVPLPRLVEYLNHNISPTCINMPFVNACFSRLSPALGSLHACLKAVLRLPVASLDCIYKQA